MYFLFPIKHDSCLSLKQMSLNIHVWVRLVWLDAHLPNQKVCIPTICRLFGLLPNFGKPWGLNVIPFAISAKSMAKLGRQYTLQKIGSEWALSKCASKQ